MKKNWLRHKLLKFVFIIVAFLAFTGVVMLLWNHTLPEVTGVKALSYFQAMGILVLSKILFGGFAGGGPRGRWREKMKQKMGSMTAEEKEKFTAEWKNRCGNRWKMHSKEIPGNQP